MPSDPLPGAGSGAAAANSHSDSHSDRRSDRRGEDRSDGRSASELRPLAFQWDPMGFALASLTITAGRTRGLCSVCLEPEVPRWRRGSGQGWLSAEYRLLPASTPERGLLRARGAAQDFFMIAEGESKPSGSNCRAPDS